MSYARKHVTSIIMFYDHHILTLLIIIYELYYYLELIENSNYKFNVLSRTCTSALSKSGMRVLPNNKFLTKSLILLRFSSENLFNCINYKL